MTETESAQLDEPKKRRWWLILVSTVTAIWIVISVLAAIADASQTLSMISSACDWLPFCGSNNNDKTVIVIADFTGDNGGASTSTPARIYNELVERVSDFDDIEIVLANEVARSEEQARAIGQDHDATIVIWGIADNVDLQPYILVVDDVYGAGQFNIENIQRDIPSELLTNYLSTDLPNQLEFVTLFILGYSLFLEDNYAEAIDIFDEALSLSLPDDMDQSIAYYYRGFARRRLGDFSAAVADYDSALRINPNHGISYINRGVAHYYLGDFELARDDYTNALASADEDVSEIPAIHYNLGLTLSELRMDETAVEQFTMAIDFDSNYYSAYLGRASAFANLSNLPDAINDCEYVLQRTQNDQQMYARALNNCAYILADLSTDIIDLNRALDFADQALRISPNFAAAYHTRGFIHTQLENYQEALADFERTIEIDDTVSYAYSDMGYVHFLLGEDALALEALDQALVLDDENPDTYYFRASVYDHLGDSEMVCENYAQFVRFALHNDDRVGQFSECDG